jgi:hypothetical protein
LPFDRTQLSASAEVLRRMVLDLIAQLNASERAGLIFGEPAAAATGPQERTPQ